MRVPARVAAARVRMGFVCVRMGVCVCVCARTRAFKCWRTFVCVLYYDTA